MDKQPTMLATSFRKQQS